MTQAPGTQGKERAPGAGEARPEPSGPQPGGGDGATAGSGAPPARSATGAPPAKAPTAIAAPEVHEGHPRPSGGPDFTIITGMSGAGRSEAARCLEDLGYFVVDNLPPALIGKMAELAASSGGPQRVAIVADVRGGVFFRDLATGLEELHRLKIPYRIMYLEASDDDLVNRFEGTRRRHPLAAAGRVVEGIRKERLMMESLRGDADLIIDTSRLSPHELRERVRDAFAHAKPRQEMQIAVLSFGYKYGIPRDADLVLDVRFLPNPHWVPRLRPLPGTDARVRRYVTQQEAYGEFMKRLRDLLDFVVPGYLAEGKSYLTVAVGCTGGRHRSVVVSEAIGAHFAEQGLPIAIDHRDMERAE
ncbi:MAG: RNase adapter RapZ [Actinomycetota bacterium]